MKRLLGSEWFGHPRATATTHGRTPGKGARLRRGQAAGRRQADRMQLVAAPNCELAWPSATVVKKIVTFRVRRALGQTRNRAASYALIRSAISLSPQIMPLPAYKTPLCCVENGVCSLEMQFSSDGNPKPGKSNPDTPSRARKNHVYAFLTVRKMLQKIARKSRFLLDF